MSTPWVFDKAHYDALNTSRGEMVRRLLPELKQRLSLKTALDLGCGLGFYASLLRSFGLDVLAIDGRAENVEEARRRHPEINLQVGDAQDSNLSRLGSFDLVFCFGLLYHLENPFRVIRNISALTPKVTLIEGIVYPSPEPAMVLMDENDCVDQGLSLMAFYPSESCLVKMLRRSGFAHCYAPDRMPVHPDYQPGSNGFRRRSVLVGCKAPIDSSVVTPWPEPSPEFGPWAMTPLYPARRVAKVYGAVDRLLRSKRN